MATIKDVAKHAGVSIATVSRIINNRGAISEKTRQKVSASMEALNYQPNEMARALQKQKSNIIGLIVPLIQYEFFSTLIEAIEDTCHQNGYKLMLCRAGANGDREKEMVALLEGNKVDGILLCSRAGDASIYAERNTMPIVSIDRDMEGFSSVTSDNYQGGILAARKLYETGCTHPVLVGNRVPDYMPMNKRCIGFFDTCRELHMEPYHISVSVPVENQAAVSENFLRDLRRCPAADGIFVISDALAATILCSPCVKEAGILNRLPLISYDGLEVSRWLSISSVAQPIREMGAAAALQLIREIEDGASHTQIVLPVSFIERESTKDYKRGKRA